MKRGIISVSVRGRVLSGNGVSSGELPGFWQKAKLKILGIAGLGISHGVLVCYEID